MRHYSKLFAFLLILCLLAGCSGGAGKGSGSAPGAESDKPAASGTESAASEEVEQIPGTYVSSDGWIVDYDPELIEIGDEDEHSVEFLYTGEQEGDNYLIIEYIPGKQPQEVLTEQIEDFDEEAVEREEGFIGPDRWYFGALVDDSDEVEITIDYKSMEYKDGVLLSTIHTTPASEGALEFLMDDALHDIVNSMTFAEEEPQTMFSYYPGTYKRTADAEDAPDTVVLYEDHSGSLISEGEDDEEDETIVIWTSTELVGRNEAASWEYTIEGDNLYLNLDDDWVEYAKDTSIAAESGGKAESSSVKEMIAQQNEKAHNGADAAGQITPAADPAAQSVPAADTAALGTSAAETAAAGTTAAETAAVNPVISEKDAEKYQKEIEDLYSKDGPGTIGRIHKMQAFLMELALHAKTKNPDFKIVLQGAEYLGFKDGNIKNELDPSMMALIDGWGIEGMVGKDSSLPPNSLQRPYIALSQAGKYISDSTVITSEEDLESYLAKAKSWGVVPFPRIGGELAQELYPGQRWAENFDYFWVEDPETIGLSEYVDGSRNVFNLKDAGTYLYNINGRPYDNWNLWDQEEAVFEEGAGDRTRITDSYGCGLLVPSENGPYKPVGEDPDDESIAEITDEYGDHWDWWWREAGLDENSGREAWLDAIRNSDYDVVYIDSCYNHRAGPDQLTPLTKEEVESLKTKPDGGRRQVLSYLAIGTAEQNRWYCQDDWKWHDPTNLNSTYSMKTGEVQWIGNRSYYIPFEATETGGEAEGDPIPSWLAFSFGYQYPEESVVQWWHKDWRDIIINGGGKYSNIATGDNTSSLDRIMDQGFDGVYLDNADSCWDDAWFSYEDYWAERGGIPTE